MMTQAHAALNRSLRPILAMVAVTGIVLAMLLGSAGFAAERVALVIGNSEYASAGHLKNARSDAKAVADALARLGFRIIEGADAQHDEMRRLIRGFSRDAEAADIALFYYAGHALQLNGRNYLVPVDATLERESDLDFETVDIDVVLRQMERQMGTSIVLLDACRNNPLATKLAGTMGQRSASLGKGLARIETGVGSFIGFATQPDNVAYDGKEGGHSPFTTALLKHIETPGLDIEMMMRRVREDVMETTAGRQIPWSNSSLIGEGVVLAPVAQAGQEPGNTASDVEITYWKSVKDSGNPNLLRAYLSDFPDGSFASLARTLLDEIESAPRSIDRKQPAVILGPPPEETVPEPPAEVETETAVPEAAPAVEAESPLRDPPPIARKKPDRKTVSAPKPSQQKAPAKKATQKKAPAKKAPATAAISPPQQAKDCDYCYGCESLVPTCRRQWVCGRKYTERLAAGLCRR